jgi:hypothetical protein
MDLDLIHDLPNPVLSLNDEQLHRVFDLLARLCGKIIVEGTKGAHRMAFHLNEMEIIGLQLLHDDGEIRFSMEGNQVKILRPGE